MRTDVEAIAKGDGGAARQTTWIVEFNPVHQFPTQDVEVVAVIERAQREILRGKFCGDNSQGGGNFLSFIRAAGILPPK